MLSNFSKAVLFFYKLVHSLISAKRHFSKIFSIVAVYLFFRTYHEFNILFIESRQTHEMTVSTAKIDRHCPQNDGYKELLSANKFSAELAAIRKEHDKLDLMISKLNQEYVSKHHFEIALKGFKGEKEAYNIEELRSFLINEFHMIQIQRLGKVDYALKESGSKVVAHSATHDHGSKIIRWKGIPLFFDLKSPDIVLSKPSEIVVPGNCWPFKGNMGFLAIKLYRPVNVTSISYEHVSSRLLPNDELKSAPKLIELWVGLDENVYDYLGFFEFELRDFSVQTFLLPHAKPVNFVQFNVLENYGDQFTCLYRIRVHGEPL